MNAKPSFFKWPRQKFMEVTVRLHGKKLDIFEYVGLKKQHGKEAKRLLQAGWNKWRKV